VSFQVGTEEAYLQKKSAGRAADEGARPAGRKEAELG
jgi:hypothetical protein